MDVFHKSGDPGSLRMEAASLRWLAQATDGGGAPVVAVLDEGEGWLDLERLDDAPPTPEAAERFGRALAHTHAAGAPSFGCAPPGWTGAGPRRSGPMPLHAFEAEPPTERCAEFYATYQLLPYIPRARHKGAIDATGAAVLERVAQRLLDGDVDHAQPKLVGDGAARLHGDLWGGNVVWAAHDAEGVPVRGVLIDPAAHGGHAETDLAALDLFGVAHLDRILDGYHEASPLADGWRERVGLHQLTMLLMHAVIFGEAYGPQTVAVAQRYA